DREGDSSIDRVAYVAQLTRRSANSSPAISQARRNPVRNCGTSQLRRSSRQVRSITNLDRQFQPPPNPTKCLKSEAARYQDRRQQPTAESADEFSGLTHACNRNWSQFEQLDCRHVSRQMP